MQSQNLITVVFLFIEILVIIPKIGNRTALFCSSQLLAEAINNPTGFCEAQGVLIQYASLVIGELFVIYNIVLFKVSLTKLVWKNHLPFFMVKTRITLNSATKSKSMLVKTTVVFGWLATRFSVFAFTISLASVNRQASKWEL